MRNGRLSLIPWFVAVVLGLALAYWASLPTGDESNSKVPVVTIKESAIATIELSGAGVSVRADKTEDLGGRWWISYDRSSNAKPESNPGDEPLKERFMASAKFKDLLSQFAPLQAIRVIGVMSDEKLVEYGLKDGTKSLVLKDASGVQLLALKIGKQLYGGRNLYALNQSDSKILLLAGDLISDFEKPELRFFERALTSSTPEDVRAGTLVQGSKTKRFVHSAKDSKGALIWTLDTAGQEPVPQASAWFERLMQLKAASYASQEEEVALKSLPVLFEVSLEGAGSLAEAIQLKRRPGASGVEYWAYSSYLKCHVKIASTRAETLEKDVPQILKD